MKTIGQKIAPILYELEMTILENQVYDGTKPNYPDSALTSATHIFMSVLLDKMWEDCDKENLTIKQRGIIAEGCGKKLSKFITDYTGLEIKTLIKNENRTAL